MNYSIQTGCKFTGYPRLRKFLDVPLTRVETTHAKLAMEIDKGLGLEQFVSYARQPPRVRASVRGFVSLSIFDQLI